MKPLMRVALMLLIAFCAVQVVAQETPAQAEQRPLDPNANPANGIAAGGLGFRPDPFRVEAITGGGEVDANARNLGADCVGQISVEPDFRFKALSDFEALRFVFVSDSVTADASLIVRDAKGDFHCNDDSAGVHNPTVDVTNALMGDYNVWVGSMGGRVFGDLYVTTRRDVTPTSVGLNIPRPTATPQIVPTASPVPATALNGGLVARAGIETLNAGFLPDPYWIVVTGGGALDVTASVSDAECVGYTQSAPNFRLNWTGMSTRLRFLFAPLDDTADSIDAALIVQAVASDGSTTWRCNRDFAGGYTRPQVEFVNPAVGTYNVWVSEETTPNVAVSGVLYVTEKMYSPETVRPTAGTDPVAAIDGLTPQSSAFAFDDVAADPYTVPGVIGGGDLDIGALNEACPGYAQSQPSFGFMLPQSEAHLRIFFIADEAAADAALIVRMPDGSWYCNDDSFNTRQPTVDVIGSAATGGVSIWVASFNADATIPGQLVITRGSASPLDPARPAPTRR